MTISLYDATVSSFRQTLGAVSALLEKAEAFCAAKGVAPEQIIQARLAEDMLPFAYQIKSSVVHSVGAIEGVRRGTFSPDRTTPPETFPALHARITDALKTLEAMDRSEIDAFVGRDMCFVAGERRIEYTAENFLLSFSLPNFYFHAATAYDILRWQGLQIGKRDFMGKTRARR